MESFSSYEKMPNSLKKIGLSDQDFAQLDKLDWVATEKIHGANFSFTYANGTLHYAKRKSILDWTHDFFGFQHVVARLEVQIVALFEALITNYKAEQFTIYGELFGGAYLHHDVNKIAHLYAIQTGVYYSPDIHFCAFDIAIISGNDKHYLDYETAVRYFETHHILFAKPLFIGKLSHAMDFNIRINSTFPKLWNLPPLKDNLIEGIVIKPYQSLPVSWSKARPIIKLKNKEFEEEQKFHEAQKWSYIPKVSSLAEELSFILEELNNFISKNRLESAVSKIGAISFEDTSRLRAIQVEMLRDTLEDFNDNNDGLLKQLTEKQSDWIKNRLTAQINKLIGNYQKR